MRKLYLIIGLLALFSLTACVPNVPDEFTQCGILASCPKGYDSVYFGNCVRCTIPNNVTHSFNLTEICKEV